MKKRYLIFFFFLLKLTANAQLTGTQQCFGGNGDDVIRDIITTSDTGLLVIVETSSTNRDFADNHGRKDIGLIKFNKDFQLQWKKCIGDSTDNIFYAVKNSGGYTMISAGDMHSTTSEKFVTCIDNDGSVIWQYKTFIHTGPSDIDVLLPFYARNDVLFEDGSAFIQTQLDSTIQFTRILSNGSIASANTYDYSSFFNNNACPDTSLQQRFFKFFSFPLKNDKLLVFATTSWFCSTPGSELNNQQYEIFLLNADGNIIRRDTGLGYADFQDDFYTAVVKNDSIIDFIKIAYNSIGVGHTEKVRYNYIRLEVVTENSLIGVPVDMNNYYNNSQPLYPDYTHLFFNDSAIFTTLQSDNHFVLYKLKQDGTEIWHLRIDTVVYFFNLFDTDSGLAMIYKPVTGTYQILGIDYDGHVVYKKDFLDSTFNDLLPDTFTPSNNGIRGRHYNYFRLHHHSLLSYGVYGQFIPPSTTKLYQVLTQTNIFNGTLEYVNKIPLPAGKEEIYKMIDKTESEELFAVSDMPGTLRCNLGGYDLSISVLLTDVFYKSSAAKEVKLYPNPAGNQITIEIPHTTNPSFSICIYDITGRWIYQNNSTGDNTVLNTSGFTNGFYTVLVKSGNEQFSNKFIIQK